MTRIYLVRHAQSEGNFYRRAHGMYNSMLTPQGRIQLEALKKQWEIKSAMYQYDAKERYLWFLDYYPGVIERISNKYVAAFLGISPVTLSRLRRSIREEGFGVCLQGS